MTAAPDRPSAWDPGSTVWGLRGGTVAILLIIFSASGAVALLLLLFQAPRPEVVAEVSAAGVVVVTPAGSTLDLIELVRPPGGLVATATPFNGFVIDPPISREVAYGELLRATVLPVKEFPDSADIGLLRALTLEGRCRLRLQREPSGALRILVSVPGEDEYPRAEPPATCRLTGELWADPEGWPQELPIDQVVPPTGHSVLFVQTPDSGPPLRLRRFPVQSVEFDHGDPEVEESLIYRGLLRLPAYSTDGEAIAAGDWRLSTGEPVYLGDALDTGTLAEGEVLDLVLGDTLRTLFRGHASTVEIEGRNLRPNMLEYLNADSAFVWILGFALAGLLGAAAVFEAAGS